MLNKKNIFAIIILGLIAVTTTNADKPTEINFQNFADIPVNKNLQTSKVYEIDITDESDSENKFSVFNLTEKKFVPIQLEREKKEKPIMFRTSNSDSWQSLKDANGNIRNISLTADLEQSETEKEIEFEIFFDRPVNSNFISFVPENNSSLPRLIKIVDRNNIILNSTSVYSTSIPFAGVESDYFKIIFTYTNPLRLSNLQLSREYSDYYYDKAIRFLAIPDNSYGLFSDPQFAVSNSYVYNLSDVNPVKISTGDLKISKNPKFVFKEIKKDFDKDGVEDKDDNCLYTYNPDQKDINENKKGDTCDDFDYDGYANSVDNCLNIPNPDQADEDKDGLGNICDKDGESRWTENNKWIQYVAIAVLFLVIVTIFIVVYQKADKNN